MPPAPTINLSFMFKSIFITDTIARCLHVPVVGNHFGKFVIIALQNPTPSLVTVHCLNRTGSDVHRDHNKVVGSL